MTRSLGNGAAYVRNTILVAEVGTASQGDAVAGVLLEALGVDTGGSGRC